jgi:hypothetical protein
VGWTSNPQNELLAVNVGLRNLPEYSGSVFAVEHGSWNRSKLTGHKVIRTLCPTAQALCGPDPVAGRAKKGTVLGCPFAGLDMPRTQRDATRACLDWTGLD